MEKIHSKLRRTDYYDFGHGLTLMNVLFKTEDGKLDRIDTYIGVEGNEFVCVGCAKDLSAPGVIFSYGEYVRFQRANKATYLDFFKQNSRSHIIVDDRAHTIDQFEYSARDCAPQPLKLSIHSGGIEHPCRCR